MPTFPEWWNWGLSFTSHAELRMGQRGVAEVVAGKFMIHVRHLHRSWMVVVEPDAESSMLVAVTVYKVSQ